jgi:hypothetical protein
MGGDGDKFAGKVKEAAGDLKNVGKNVKDKADELGEKIKDWKD